MGEYVDRLPEGRMKDAIMSRPEHLAEEFARRYIEADPVSRMDILDFFASDGPKMVRESRLKVSDNVPTSDDLNKLFGES